MTSPVTYMIHSIDGELIKRLFAKFTSRYGSLWTGRIKNDEDWIFCAQDWQEELSSFDVHTVRQAVNDALSIYKEYPPTLGQLTDLCLKATGVPSEDQVIKLMANSDFSHPIVKMIYHRIGSWTLKNAKSEEIRSKASAVYNECLNKFKENPQQAWLELTVHNEQKALEAPEPAKIPSPEERKGFKERMADYQQKLDDQKFICKGKTYKEFEPSAISPRHKDFNQAIYDEFKAYLLSIPDSQTMILPTKYIYERMRIIGQLEQSENLKKQGYIPPKEREGYESLQSSDRNGKPTKIYKNWMND